MMPTLQEERLQSLRQAQQAWNASARSRGAAIATAQKFASGVQSQLRVWLQKRDINITALPVHLSPNGSGTRASVLTQVSPTAIDLAVRFDNSASAVGLAFGPSTAPAVIWTIPHGGKRAGFVYVADRDSADSFYARFEAAVNREAQRIESEDWDAFFAAAFGAAMGWETLCTLESVYRDLSVPTDDASDEEEEPTTPAPPRDHSWETLILPPKTKELLRDVAMMWQNAARLPKGVNVPQAVLLHGPPGTGKTEIARTLENELGIKLLPYRAGDLMGTKGGGSGIAAIRKIFDEARDAAPAILFIDELDGIAPADTSLHGGLQEVRPELLTQIEGFKKSEGLFFLAATNYPDKLDPAIRSRFTEQIEIPLPDEEGRAALIRSLLQRKPFEGDLDSLAQRIAGETNGKSGRDIVGRVARAEMRAAKRAIESGSPETTRITEGDFD